MPERSRSSLYGKLSANDLINLRASGLSDETIRENGLYTEGNPDKFAALLNRSPDRPGKLVPEFCLCGGLVFTHYDLSENNGYVTVRPRSPRVREGKPVKYEAPAGESSRPYFPKRSRPQLRKDNGPIHVTESWWVEKSEPPSPPRRYNPSASSSIPTMSANASAQHHSTFMVENYYVKDHQGRVSGPFSGSELKKLAREKKLELSWHISADRIKWCPAAKVKNLSADLEKLLAENLATEEQYRKLRRQEVIALFLDKFILNNENFKDAMSFLQPIRVWWAKPQPWNAVMRIFPFFS
jgi:hypothetical protein